MIERSQKRHPRSYQELAARITELEIKLAIANEALRIESTKSELAQRAIEASERKCRSLKACAEESAVIVRRMEAELKETLKSAEAGKIMIPALIHDLGNLLAAIKSHSQYCLQTMDLTASMEETMGVIYECSQRADRLIRDFLELFRLVKFTRIDRKPINVNDAVSRIWKTLKPQTLSRRISFSLDLEENLPEIEGDVEKLERVFFNLFLNAIQAVSENGKITVRTLLLPGERTLEVKVMDDGPGIPESDRQKIFEPFFTTKAEGTGLGLSISQTIVQQHDGRLAFESVHPMGTTFSVRLPIDSKEEIHE